MTSQDSKKSTEQTAVYLRIIAQLGDLTKKTSNFEELREMLPLLSDLKKTETHNREMGDILSVISKAIAEIKSNNGNISRAASTYSNGLDRMIGQANNEMAKVRDSLKVKAIATQQLKDKHSNLQKALLFAIQEEVLLEKNEIEQIVAINTQKIKEYIKKQEAELCLSSESIRENAYKSSVLKNKLQKNRKINAKLQQCQTIFGQLLCYSIHLQQSNKIKADSQDNDIESFIKLCDCHFEREYPLVLQKLRLFEEIKYLNNYEQRIFCQYYSWGNRLKISLESAIIKLSIDLRRNNKEVYSFMHQKLRQWESMHDKLKELLELNSDIL